MTGASPDPGGEAGPGERPGGDVRLDVPAGTDQLRLVRLLVAGLASQHGADLDDLEDLRLAVGEVAALVVRWAPPGSRLIVEADVTEGVLRAWVALGGGVRADRPPADEAAEFDDLSSTLLTTVADRFGTDINAATAWFERRLRGPDAS